MSTYSSSINNGQKPPMPGTDGSSPMAQAARDGAARAMEFQLWVSEQAASLSKLKVFHTMAKSINDQS